MIFRDKLLRPVVKFLELAQKGIASDYYVRNGFPTLHWLHGGGAETHTGKLVDEITAFNCSIVWLCTRIISETLAALPRHLMERRDDGKYPATDEPLYRVLHDEPNGEMDDMTFWETLGAHAVTWGNGYARKVFRGSTDEVIGLWPFTPNQVTSDRTKETGELVHVVKDGNAAEKTFPARDIYHLHGLGFDGTRGYSVIQMARQSIALAQIQEEYAAKWFARGGRRPYILEHPQRFKNDDEFKAFQERWKAGYGNIDSFHNPPVLEGGLKLVEQGFSLEDIQFLQSRQFHVAEIGRWFRISPTKLGDLSRATFNNAEQYGLEFYQETMMPWCIRVEKSVNRQLLSNKQKERLYLKHNISGLLRGDFASRMAGYATAAQNGWLNRDEIRDLEDMNPIPNGAGKGYTIQLNMQTLPGTGAETATQLAARANAEARQSRGASA